MDDIEFAKWCKLFFASDDLVKIKKQIILADYSKKDLFATKADRRNKMWETYK